MSKFEFVRRMDRQLLLQPKEIQTMMPALDENLLFMLERRYLDILDVRRLELAGKPLSQNAFDMKQDLRLFEIEEVAYDHPVDTGMHLYNMQNVLASSAGAGHSLVMIIRGEPQGVSIYYGIARTDITNSAIKTDQYATSFGRAFHGNFDGVKIRRLGSREIFEKVMTPLAGATERSSAITAITGIPSVRSANANEPFVQGLDRFLETMRGEKYMLLCLVEPIPLPEIDQLIQRCRDIGSDNPSFG